VKSLLAVDKNVLTADCAGCADLKRKERRKLWEYSREGVDS